MIQKKKKQKHNKNRRHLKRFRHHQQASEIDTHTHSHLRDMEVSGVPGRSWGHRLVLVPLRCLLAAACPVVIFCINYSLQDPSHRTRHAHVPHTHSAFTTCVTIYNHMSASLHPLVITLRIPDTGGLKKGKQYSHFLFG